MRSGLKTILLWAAFLVFIAPEYAGAQMPGLILKEAPLQMKIGKHVEYLKVPDANLNLSDIQNRKGWLTSSKHFISFGYIRSRVWIRFFLENSTKEELSFFLQENNSIVDDLRFFLPDGKGGFKTYKTGDLQLFNKRKVQHRSFLAPIQIPPGRRVTIYISYKSSGSTRSDLHLLSRRGLYQQISYEEPYMWLFFGFLLVIFIYNFCLYLSIRDLAYLYYVLYLFFFLIIQFSLQGYGVQYLWPEYAGLTNIILRHSVPLCVMFFVLFFREFMGIKRYYRWLDRVSLGQVGLAFAAFWLVFWMQSHLIWKIILMGVGAFSLVFSFIIILLIRKKSKEAMIVAVAFSFFTPAILPFVLDLLGFIPVSAITRFGLILGSGLDLTLLSLALAYRIKRAGAEQSKSEKRFRNLIKNISHVIFTLDNNLMISSLNPAVLKELGYEDRELLGTYFPDLAHEEPNNKNYSMRRFIAESCKSLSRNTLRSSFKAAINTRYKPEPLNMQVDLELIPGAGPSQILVRMSPVVESFLIDSLADEKQVYKIRNRFNEVEFLSQRLTSRLSNKLSKEDVLSVGLGLREALYNAIEHGNLEMDTDTKSIGLENGNYLDIIQERGKGSRFKKRRVWVEYTLTQDSVSYRIRDEGLGFDYASVLAGGKDEGIVFGLFCMQNIFDTMEFQGRGNEVLLVKSLAS